MKIETKFNINDIVYVENLGLQSYRIGTIEILEHGKDEHQIKYHLRSKGFSDHDYVEAELMDEKQAKKYFNDVFLKQWEE